MRSSLTCGWQKRRSGFNHDWLKNEFLPALGRCANLLDERIEDEEFEREFPITGLSEWEQHREEAFALAEDFRLAMSPRVLLDRPPLCRIDQEVREWLGALTHELWLARYPVNRWIQRATAQASAADSAYNDLLKAMARPAPAGVFEVLRRCREQFFEFRRQCQQLGQALSEFPSEVLVT